MNLPCLNNTTDELHYASNHDLQQEIDNEGGLQTQLYDKGLITDDVVRM